MGLVHEKFYNLNNIVICFNGVFNAFINFRPNLSQWHSDQSRDDYKVYVLFNGKKRWIKNIDVFNSYNFKWENIRLINPAVAKNIKINNLVREAGDIKVYALNDNGYKRHIVNPAVF